MNFYVFASGSKGNSTLVTTNDGHSILIDFGISKKSLVSKLDNIGFSYESIEAFLFTHEHTDHIGGLTNKSFDFSKAYCAKGTLKDILPSHELEHFKCYEIGGFNITILPTSHDAANPIGFLIEADDQKLVYMTDTGYILDKSLEKMSNADYYIIESNYNYRKLLATSRPQSLKLRIISDYGHLCNDESAEYISHLVGNLTKEVFLAHISQEANTHELALEAFTNRFKKEGIDLTKILLIACDQYETVVGGEQILV